MKDSIFIRVDGSSTIGLGHVVRCLALAQMLKDDFEITFYCKEITDSVSNEIITKGFGYKKIDNEEEIFNKLNSTIILVLDGYHFDTTYQKRIKETGCKLVCIDDLHDKEFFADLIINHTPGINSQDYVAQPYTKFALGLEYALLRPAFLEQAKKERLIQKIENVMICFGGSDPQNFTQKAVKTAIGFSQFKKIIAVTGSAYKPTESFIKLVESDNRIEHRHALSEEMMLKTMLDVELAIVSASGILLEVFCCNILPLICFTVDNQKKMFRYFVDNYSVRNFSNNIKSFQQKSLRKELGLINPQELKNLRTISLTLSKAQYNITNLFKSTIFCK